MRFGIRPTLSDLGFGSLPPISAHSVLTFFLHAKQFAVGCGKQAGHISGMFRKSSDPEADSKLDLDTLVEQIDRANYP
jgi:hypothetical protein